MLLERKPVTNPDSVLKSRDITLPISHIVKTVVFPVVMYRYESGTMKKTECQRIDAFELWCWKKLLRVFSRVFLDSKKIKPVNLKRNQS